MLEVRFGAQPFAGTLQRDTAEIEQRPVVRPDLALALKPLDGAVVGLNRLLEALLGAQQVTLARQRLVGLRPLRGQALRSEEHTSELQSLMRISYAVFCLKKKKP